MLYPLLRRLLFEVDAERAHNLTLDFLKICHKTGLTRLLGKTPSNRQKVSGLEFENRVGLAAGFDKNGDYIDALAALGFGFIEIGTVTPRPQPGNERPRLFRNPDYCAVINRMGFNNKGVDYAASRLDKVRFKGIIGVNIGKNLTTSIEKAHNDYLYCLKKVYPYAGYVAVNVSSPNTPGLRSIQDSFRLRSLLDKISSERKNLYNRYEKRVPILVKISPDLNDLEIESVSQAFNDSNIDGIIATNTTISREEIVNSRFADQIGGLSGAPLKRRAEYVLKSVRKLIKKDTMIIASGGIMNPDDALQRVRLGADLVQVYTGLIYSGPTLIKRISSKMKKFAE
jgi:dihydroorotate dehydrogenase